MIPVVVTGTVGGPRLRMTDCPRCRRPVTLNHCGFTDDDGQPWLDMDRVDLAQRLHLRSCSG